MGLQVETTRSFSEFSNLGVGGPIDYFAEVKTLDQMIEGLHFAKQKGLPFFILGKGSNCLFSDQRFSGVVLLNKIKFCNWFPSKVEVGAGYSFSLLGTQTAKKGFSGLEFATGIPASVGGAVFMNAGANKGEVKDLLISVTFIDQEGSIHTFKKEELEFRYRYSSFHKMKGAIVSANFSLERIDQEARQKQIKIIEYRNKTQPLNEKSIGCIFRNPLEGSAGALIEKCNLKGLTRGDAKVSEIHANFIINKGNATSVDVTHLIKEIQKIVLLQTGVHLEPEVRLI